LVPIGLAIGGMLALAFAIAAAVTVAGLNLLGFRGFKPEPLLSAATLYDLLKVAFAVAAGIGGVIALVTAYRRQRVAEFAEQREGTRLFNERFATAAGQLGDDRPAVRLAGVYAMAGLADDWPQQRQTCVDVLCAYLRMPYEPELRGRDQQQIFRAAREVRHTAIRVITAHLQPDNQRAATMQDWRGLDLDFTGTVFDGGSFRSAEFTGGTVSFDNAQFTGEIIDFTQARFTGGTVHFTSSEFTSRAVNFGSAEFTGATVRFAGAEFSGGAVSFAGAEFSGGTVSFRYAQFTGRMVTFTDARFTGATVEFGSAEFTGGTVSFNRAAFTGGIVSLADAAFTGGTVEFSSPTDWSVPPHLPLGETPPPGVLLPAGQHEQPGRR
jgi:uncharacterized protein YjbI with pentapeptide repeats